MYFSSGMLHHWVLSRWTRIFQVWYSGGKTRSLWGLGYQHSHNFVPLMHSSGVFGIPWIECNVEIEINLSLLLKRFWCLELTWTFDLLRFIVLLTKGIIDINYWLSCMSFCFLVSYNTHSLFVNRQWPYIKKLNLQDDEN